MAKPKLLPASSGDPELINRIVSADLPGDRLAVVELDTGQQCGAYFGCAPDTRFEIGSISKAITGLLIADAIDRGEVILDAPLGELLPATTGRLADITLRQLVTHTSGLPRLVGGAPEFWRASRAVLRGQNPYHWDLTRLIVHSNRSKLRKRSFAYSNSGAALAGHGLAASLGISYPTLVQQRILGPLGMLDSSVQTRDAQVAPGRDASGRLQQPWVLDAEAPAGGIVSTGPDMALLAGAILDGSAPGLAALTPLTEIGDDEQVGIFWFDSPSPDKTGRISWHNGGTGGYSSYLAVDRERERALVVLSSLEPGADQLAAALWRGGSE